jgi:2-polyprenyl-3-methyl-5-hydroxy-6-metoxy-1,4-benzoquinol methylase
MDMTQPQRTYTVLIPEDADDAGRRCKKAFQRAAAEDFETIAVFSRAVLPPAAMAALYSALAAHPEAGGVLGMPARSSGARQRLNGAMMRLQRFFSGEPLPSNVPRAALYRTSAVQRVVYELNTNTRYFDTELWLQFSRENIRLHEVELEKLPAGAALPGLRGALKACVKYRLQKLPVFFDFRYHPEFFRPRSKESAPDRSAYPVKLEGLTPHTFLLSRPDLIRPGMRVLDVGCSQGVLAKTLAARFACDVTGIDRLPPRDVSLSPGFDYRRIDLDQEMKAVAAHIEENDYDVVLMLDVLEHLASPEIFLWHLANARFPRKTRLIVSTGNVAFWVIRLMLLLGYFNYGERGILDITHKRLFSWRTFGNLFDQLSFRVVEKHGIPLPSYAFGFRGGACRFLDRLQRLLIALRPSLFSYQILLVLETWEDD